MSIKLPEPKKVTITREQAIQKLEEAKIFSPTIQHNYDRILLISNLPPIAEDKPEVMESTHKKMMKVLVQKMVVLVVPEGFKKSMIDLHPRGQTCVIRFPASEQAAKFKKQFEYVNDSSLLMFGPDFKLKIDTYEQFCLCRKVQQPVLADTGAFKQIQLKERFTHLTEEDVISQLALVKPKAWVQLANFQQSLGYTEHLRLELQEQFQFTAKGTFIFTCQKTGALTESLTFFLEQEQIFKIRFEQPAEEFFVSPGENFVVALSTREFQKQNQYRAQIYSLFEEGKIFETEWCARNDVLQLQEQLQFNALDSFFYALDGNFVGLHEMVNEDGLLVQKLKTRQQMNNVHALQWAPVGDYLAVFQKSKLDAPSQFTVINPALQERNMRVISRTFYVEQIKLVWQQSGKTVSVITDTKQCTQIMNYQMGGDYPASATKFPPGSKIREFQYSSDGKFCVCLVTSKQNPKPSVFIQQVNSDQAPQKIISLDAEKIFFCPQTNVFVIVSGGSQSQTVSFVDAVKKCYLASYDFCIKSLEFDFYGRYLAVLDKQDTKTWLNIIDCVGTCLYVKQVNGVEMLKWRPEDKEMLKVGEEGSLYEQRCEQLEKENAAKVQQKYNQMQQAFDRAFCNQAHVEYGRKQKEQQVKLVRSVFPQYEEGEEEVVVSAIQKLNETLAQVQLEELKELKD